ncbi:MAG: hypothetical protein HC802_19150 [Caldilineaceae bacterium]|nr:hypothetical protein [Caldilineaceae bacterium]
MILDLPAGADYDLYLYQESYGSLAGPALAGATGDPRIAKRPDNSEIKKTTAAAGGKEEMSFQVARDGLYFLVVRRVSGAGEFTIRLITPEEWTVLVYMPAELAADGDPDRGAGFAGDCRDQRHGADRFRPGVHEGIPGVGAGRL